jgi:hypothetical protein
MTVFVYINTSKQVGDPEHIKTPRRPAPGIQKGRIDATLRLENLFEMKSRAGKERSYSFPQA